jgi:hypothetical protein
VARSGQESIAQGLPWVNSPTGVSPEGAGRYSENRLRTFEPDRVRISSPFSFRAKRLFRVTQGKPWAKLSCPFGAGPSGRFKRRPADEYLRVRGGKCSGLCSLSEA